MLGSRCKRGEQTWSVRSVLSSSTPTMWSRWWAGTPASSSSTSSSWSAGSSQLIQTPGLSKMGSALLACVPNKWSMTKVPILHLDAVKHCAQKLCWIRNRYPNSIIIFCFNRLNSEGPQVKTGLNTLSWLFLSAYVIILLVLNFLFNCWVDEIHILLRPQQDDCEFYHWK